MTGDRCLDLALYMIAFSVQNGTFSHFAPPSFTLFHFSLPASVKLTLLFCGYGTKMQTQQLAARDFQPFKCGDCGSFTMLRAALSLPSAAPKGGCASHPLSMCMQFVTSRPCAKTASGRVNKHHPSIGGGLPCRGV